MIQKYKHFAYYAILLFDFFRFFSSYFKQIKTAYEILSDPQQRATYDASLTNADGLQLTKTRKIPLAVNSTSELSLQPLPEEVPRQKKRSGYGHWLWYFIASILIGSSYFALFVDLTILDKYLGQIALLDSYRAYFPQALRVLLGLGIFILLYALSLHIRLWGIYRTLLAGERVIYYTSIHLFIYFFPLLLIGGCSYALFVDPALFESYIMKVAFLQDKLSIVQLGMKVLLGIGGLILLYAFYQQFSTILAVTHQRTIAQFGFKKVVEVEHARFENIQISYGIFGRFFLYGTVNLRGTSGRGVGGLKIKVKYVAFPKQLQNKIALALSEV